MINDLNIKQKKLSNYRQLPFKMDQYTPVNVEKKFHQNVTIFG